MKWAIILGVGVITLSLVAWGILTPVGIVTSATSQNRKD